VSIGFADVDALFDALTASRDADDEGGLPILDHSLQCAMRLRESHPDDVELQVAGLVHDLGWFEQHGGAWTLQLDAAHDVEGRALVAGLLGERIAALVGGHVAAKRYLLATDLGYASLLSARSEETLGFQGGVMTPAEVMEFERRPDRDDLVALRRADDAAKVRGAPVDSLDAWRAAVEQIAAHH
jgi:predicted HD phosphohydrolase